MTSTSSNEPSGPVMGSSSSMDGRAFKFSADGTAALRAGTLLSLVLPNNERFTGQIHQLSQGKGESMRGTGRILGRAGATGSHPGDKAVGFAHAEVTEATAETAARLQASKGAVLEVGTFAGSTDMTAYLIPGGFNRHTFWCGQSGSGKTYALGVVLEELLLRTRLPMIVLDPNADFVEIRRPSASASEAVVKELASKDVRVLSAKPASADQIALRASYGSLSTRAKAAVLRMDPLIHRDEYNQMLQLQQLIGRTDPDQLKQVLRSTGEQGAIRLAARIENLEITGWRVWARGLATASRIIAERPDAAILDLSGFDHPDEPLVIAMSVLDELWERRFLRQPMLIVIDEAHNLCSPDQDSPLHQEVRGRIAQIAAEGRKFGLWLLLSTQRPSKIDRNIVSQCDNLALMKMSSTGDLAELIDIFGHVPAEMLSQAAMFEQGEMLLAGSFAALPMIVNGRQRWTRQGGSDLGVPLREDRQSIVGT